MGFLVCVCWEELRASNCCGHPLSGGVGARAQQVLANVSAEFYNHAVTLWGMLVAKISAQEDATHVSTSVDAQAHALLAVLPAFGSRPGDCFARGWAT